MCNFRAPLIYAQRYDENRNLRAEIYNNERTLFQKDRDKVIYCPAFRRLSGKTQVFNSAHDDHLRTRLTHSLEVAQIARSIASRLNLDVDLTEAIALGHDIGHAPFGHVGERELNTFMNKGNKRVSYTKFEDDGIETRCSVPKELAGFKHNLQSMRALIDLSDNWSFTNFMIYGVSRHSKITWKDGSSVNFYDKYVKYCSYVDNKNNMYPAWSFEAFIVQWADEIAQRHHDIEDAYIQRILNKQEIVDCLTVFSDFFNDRQIVEDLKKLSNSLSNKNKFDVTSIAHRLSKFVVNVYVTKLVKLFRQLFESNIWDKYKDREFKDFYLELNENKIYKLCLFEESELVKADQKLHEILKHAILDSYNVQIADGKGAYIIRCLLKAYMSNPQQLPDDIVCRFIKNECQDSNEAREIIKEFINVEKTNIYSWEAHTCRNMLRKIYRSENLKNKEVAQFEIIAPILMRSVCDYVAGMTDAYALGCYQNMYGFNL